VDKIGLRVIGNGIPYRAATTNRPPFTVPGFGCHAHGVIFKTKRRVARHGVEAPILLTGFGIVSSDVATHAEFSTRAADQYLAFHHAWRASDRVAPVLVDGHHRPHFLAGRGINSNQTT